MSPIPPVEFKKMLPSARFLIQDNKIPEAKMHEFFQAASTAKQDFFHFLVQNSIVDSHELAIFLSQKFNLPFFDISAFDLQSCPKPVDAKMIRSTHCVPLSKRNKTLFVAVSDPSNESGPNDLKFKYNCNAVQIIVTDVVKLNEMIEKIGQNFDTSLTMTNQPARTDIEFEEESDSEAPIEVASAADVAVDEAPVVKLLQQTLIDAITSGASDIHFEPYEKMYRIRFRQDGVLDEYRTVPVAIKDKLSSRIKVLSKLDISNRLIPQDGRMRLKLDHLRKVIDFRVSTLPTLFGEKIVMRILDPSSAQLGIDALGYDPDQRTRLLDAVARPYGMVLVTGPTGSGKTVSLYTCLNYLNDVGRNISTAEDPAEINLPGINQVNINEKQGLTFPVALKSFLRQDPDVIMVGEIRDLETANIAIKAALTGHMVLSTLHTNDAPSTLTRLVDMGVPPFNITSAISLITAQRLGRRLCSHCKTIDETITSDILLSSGLPASELDGFGSSWHAYKPVGCSKCKNGYRGRVGIYQVMPISESMRKAILRGANSIEIAEIAQSEGIYDLRQSGLLKVKAGVTSLEEVNSITNE